MKKVIALDFDGTLCENAWPAIGDPKWAVIRAAQEEQQQGALLILWTTREGKALGEALEWCDCAFYYPIFAEYLPVKNMIVWDKMSG